MKFTLSGGYYRSEDARAFLKSLKEPIECIFESDPTNPADSNAVKVISHGYHIGFVPRGMKSSMCLDVPGKVIPTGEFYSRFQPDIECSAST